MLSYVHIIPHISMQTICLLVWVKIGIGGLALRRSYLSYLRSPCFEMIRFLQYFLDQRQSRSFTQVTKMLPTPPCQLLVSFACPCFSYLPCFFFRLRPETGTWSSLASPRIESKAFPLFLVFPLLFTHSLSWSLTWISRQRFLSKQIHFLARELKSGMIWETRRTHPVKRLE